MDEEDGANGTDGMKDNNVINGRPGYDASDVNQHTFQKKVWRSLHLRAEDEAPPSEYLHWRRRMVLVRRDCRQQAGNQAGDNSLVLKCNW